MSQKERRKFSRIPLNSIAIIRNRKAQNEGKIENLSLNGALVNLSERVESGGDLEIEIFVVEPKSDLSIKLNGKVLRQTTEGIAIQFTGMYLDDFGRLRDQIASNLGNKDKVVEEFLEYLSK
jgi:hypothetical protein